MPDPRHFAGLSVIRLLFALVGVCLVFQGCSTTSGLKGPTSPQTGLIPATSDRGLNPQQLSLANASCYGGLPIDTSPDTGPTELIIRTGYVLEHSSVDKIPLWVCENVVADQLTGHLARHNEFKADPDLKGPRSYPIDYKGSGYDRGHQAPAGNQTRDQALKDQTFYMSNMAPQRPSLNRGIWRVLEDKTRAWVIQYGHAYEWTGPILCDQPPRAALLAQRNCHPQTIGTNSVAVPLYFYKIILVQDHLKWKAIAFVMPNTNIKRPYQFEVYIKSIDWIEQQTGIEFIPNVGASQRRALKSTVSSMWP
jgi:endonuclease G, mitochondrial